MASTNSAASLSVPVIGALLCLVTPLSLAVGLDTRDQNPLLQGYFLPTLGIQDFSGWRLDQSLFISNSYHRENNGTESLLIDTETYRYQLSLGYGADRWQYQLTLPLLSNQAGRLDGVIEDWHQFFGLPQGGRGSNPDDRLDIQYIRDAATLYTQSNAASGLGDIALTVAYRLQQNSKMHSQLSFAIELPTGSEQANAGNGELDYALWLSSVYRSKPGLALYASLGLSLLGKGGQLAPVLQRQVWVAQAGLEYRFTPLLSGLVQLDLHSSLLQQTGLRGLGDSLQLQLGLSFDRLFSNQDLELFFSEDILVGSAPDITFGARLKNHF